MSQHRQGLGCCFRTHPRMRGWERGVVVLLMLAAMLQEIHGDPQSLVQNGDFESQIFSWGYFPQVDVMNKGEMDFIPFFTVIAGGVQVVNQAEYVGPPWSYGGSFALHLNNWLGPGTIQTIPLITPRWGATYNLTFDIADNPDGGPVNKGVRVVILVNNQKSGKDIPFFNVSNPDSQRSSMVWQTVSHTFVGTGQSTTIVFESLSAGSFGALIDNINVTLLNLLDNGSFEFTVPPGITRDNETFYSILAAPTEAIASWAVAAGFLKWSSNERWQSSTDESMFMLDLNANSEPGSIVSNSFATKIGASYVLLFDTAANPEPTTPVKGSLVTEVMSAPSGKSLAATTTDIDGTGFTLFSLGWRTMALKFIATEAYARIRFTSKVVGDSGPLLDNVQVFQLTKVGLYHPAPWTGLMGNRSASARGRLSAIILSTIAGALFVWFSSLDC